MTSVLKRYVKARFPRMALQVRARRKVRLGRPSDLAFLANLPAELSRCPHTRHLGSIPQNSAAIDVGANVGEYSWALAKHFKTVLCIEPVPELAAVLRRGVPGNCEVIEAAAGATVSTVNLRIPQVDNRRAGALATVASHDFEFSDIVVCDTIAVAQCTVDQLVSTRGITPFFLKIDVEGYEMSVLQGASEVIRAHRPLLLIEIEKRHTRDFLDTFHWLQARGYGCYDFRSATPEASGPHIVDTSYEYLQGSGIHGMREMVDRLSSITYVSNFLFVPGSFGAA
jgi:FkbM family methyltransferase